MSVKLLAFIGVLLLFGFAVKMYGDSRYKEGVSSSLLKAHSKRVEVKRAKQKNYKKIINLKDRDLIERYCATSVYEPSDHCLRTYIIRE